MGDKIYLYESVSFRNTDLKPRNKRISIGKIDPVGGNPLYKPEYLERMAENGTPIKMQPTQPIFSMDDVGSSSIKNYGGFYLLNHIAQKTSLLASFQEVAPIY